jgi:glutamine synthetase adenylyltransferase
MGKLGGGELNSASDIDVIFLYEDDEGESFQTLNCRKKILFQNFG